MLRNNLRGWCFCTCTLGTRAQQLDFSDLASAGIKMLVRLNYGVDGAGTLPHPHDYFEIEGFIEAAIHTMVVSHGVWGYILGNQPNNPAEFPGKTPITPEHYARVYNRVWDDKPEHVKLAPAAVDPYFGLPPASGEPEYEPDNLVWWKKMLTYIPDADFFTVHPKTQDCDPNNISSAVKFDDDPLRWQFRHLRAYEPLLDAIPDHLRPRHVHAVEVSPLRQCDGTLGWQNDLGRDWVNNAIAEFSGWNANPHHDLKIKSVIFNHYSGDEWAINDKPEILDAIKDSIREPARVV